MSSIFPIVGDSNGVWGTELTNWAEVEHNLAGTHNYAAVVGGVGGATLAAASGVSASNSDNTTQLTAAIAAAKGGTLILPTGTINFSGALTLVNANLIGAGVNATVLTCTAKLGGTTPAINVANTDGNERHIAGFTLNGPGFPTLGTKTANCTGIQIFNSGQIYLDAIKISSFDAGLVIAGGSNHIYGQRFNFTNCYYGAYWLNNNSDYHFRDGFFNGNTYAGIATPSNVGIASASFYNCHIGVQPYGVYQEAAPTNQGTNQIFLQEVTFRNSRFESIGNSAIWSDAQGTSSNFSQFADIIIENPGFSWAGGTAGSVQNLTIATQPCSYAINVPFTNRNITIIEGPNIFRAGVTNPTFGASAGAAGVFAVYRTGHNAWTRVITAGQGGASGDMTVGAGGGASNYFFGGKFTVS